MKVTVKVQSDHLERLSKVQKPIVAVEELIWNALDADATSVRVRFDYNAHGALDRITVSDNGHGLAHEGAVPAFENLGGSWKRGCARTPRGRVLHGKAGRGRFRAFALGAAVRWLTRFRRDSQVLQYEIVGDKGDLGTFEIGEPQPSTEQHTGTHVEIQRIEQNFGSLIGARSIQEVTERYALYLRKYPEVRITYDGQSIDPSLVEDLVTDCSVSPITLEDGRVIELAVTIIEWKTSTERALYLCDEEGFALAEMPPGIQAPGFNFTAYVKSAYLRELDEQNALVLEELHRDLKAILDATKDKLREHFRQRTAEGAEDVVEEWKRAKLYPFEGEAKNIIETTERQIFDVVALSLHNYLPDFERADPRSKRLSLRLLKHGLEESPSAVRRILEDVLELPAEKQAEFAELLEKTSLAAIINASKIVADRLDFLKGLELLVFDPESRKQLLERSQLHRILAEHTWVFGEEFNLTVDDQSLTEVLRKHLHLLGREPTDGEPVLREDGTVGIVDMMLSRLMPQPRGDEREHLVVELKRPKQPIDSRAAQQIKDYAFAVAEDERFRDTKTRWVFWALSNEITTSVRRDASQTNRPEGLLFEDKQQHLEVWVKTWGQVIEACTGRLKFFQQHLQYAANQDSALAYLHKTHEKYLPKVLKKPA